MVWSRQLITLGVLTALGGCEAQLKVHIGAALNVRLSAEEVAETILRGGIGVPAGRDLSGPRR
jgi:4-carboxymuconolactone decarboxylase